MAKRKSFNGTVKRDHLIVSCHIESLMANLGRAYHEFEPCEKVARIELECALARILHELYFECVGARYPGSGASSSEAALLAATGWPKGVYADPDADDLWLAHDPARRFCEILKEALDARDLDLPQLAF